MLVHMIAYICQSMCVKIKLYMLSSWYKIMFLKHTLKICLQAQNDFVFVLIIMYAC